MKLIKLGVLILLFLISNSTLANSLSEKRTASNFFAEEEKIFELVNNEREKRGLDSLNWNSKLADLARQYSQKMARENFFSHFDRNGDSIAERAKATRITRWKRIGENLFMCEGYQKFTQLALRGWMKSPPHRQNILEKNYSETGIGIARSKNGTIYVTQVFIEK